MAAIKCKKNKLYYDGVRRSFGVPYGVGREFECPLCEGVATVHNYGDELFVECHACTAQVKGKKDDRDNHGRRGRKGSASK